MPELRGSVCVKTDRLAIFKEDEIRKRKAKAQISWPYVYLRMDGVI